jgi:hypothetical protein
MLRFVVGGFCQGPLLRQVSMSLQIGSTFNNFVLGNGEISWSMWIFRLRTSYHFFFC